MSDNNTLSEEDWNWFNLISLLSIPKPSLLKGIYSKPLISVNSFSPNQPLNTRLRHADIVLYSLLSILLPLAMTKFLPLVQTPVEIKSFRNELGKLVEKVLKLEKESGSGLEKGIVWRKSFLDEAKGEKWERVLKLLAVMALRKVGNELESKEGGMKADSIEDGGKTYRLKFEEASTLLEERELILAGLRLKGLELLQASMDSSSSTESDAPKSTEYDGLDTAHLMALRDQKIRHYSKELWALKDDQANLYQITTSISKLPPQSISPTNSKSSTQLLVLRHQHLLNSLRALSDPPKPQRPQPPASSSAFSDTTSTTTTTTSLAAFLSSPKGSTPIPPIPMPPLFDFCPVPSTSTSIATSALLIPPTTSLSSIELSVAILLDSLIPPPLPIPSALPLASDLKDKKPLARATPTSGVENGKSTPSRNLKSPSPKKKLIEKSSRSHSSFDMSRSGKLASPNKKSEGIRGRYESDISRDRSMGNQVESLLNELLDDSGLMDDSY